VRAQEERARKYTAEVQSLQFNVLVTTYEYIMRDRSRLAKVWKLCSKLNFTTTSFLIVHNLLPSRCSSLPCACEQHCTRQHDLSLCAVDGDSDSVPLTRTLTLILTLTLTPTPTLTITLRRRWTGSTSSSTRRSA